jgi:hypothetical protein
MFWDVFAANTKTNQLWFLRWFSIPQKPQVRGTMTRKTAQGVERQVPCAALVTCTDQSTEAHLVRRKLQLGPLDADDADGDDGSGHMEVSWNGGTPIYFNTMFQAINHPFLGINFLFNGNPLFFREEIMKFQCSQLVDGSGCKTCVLSCLLLCYNFIYLHLQTSYEVGWSSENKLVVNADWCY